MLKARHWISVTALSGTVLLTWAPGCGGSAGSDFGKGGASSGASSGTGSGGGSSGNLFGGSSTGGTSSGGIGGGGDAGPVPCTGGNLCNQIATTCATGSTTISGTIYDPAGKNPLYNIVAYVPNEAVKPLSLGASCYQCADLYSGNPVASALTGPDGKFTIPKAPDGKNIPLVIQIGKWRRQFTIPSVAQCQDTAIPDKTLLLPKNLTVGDPVAATSIPNIGIATGGADSLECLLERIGVDPAEYAGGAGGAGHIHIFGGDGGNTTQAPGTPLAPNLVASTSMWDSKADLMKYDISILSCEGHETTAMNQQALFDYANAGGRVFASHFHYAWFDPNVAATPFSGATPLATWFEGTNTINTTYGKFIGGVIETTLQGGAAFPKGAALKAWLGNVNALGQNGVPAGELSIEEAKHNADVGAVNTLSTSWIVGDNMTMPPGATQYFSFDTPLGAPAGQTCGRVVYSDLHVGSASGDYPAMGGGGRGGGGGGGGNVNPGIVPGGCAMADLSPQEKALEFMLFDLSACIVPNSAVPMPPVGGAK